jgi:amidophosphoribosyltransferase
MCGVFGVIGKEIEAAKLSYLGLYALQHRGQESAGIAVVDRAGHIEYHKGMGLVSQVFNENILQGLPGAIAIGHNRYSTTGSSQVSNAQPIIVQLGDGHAVLAHNGNLINTRQLRDELTTLGYTFTMSSDSELIALLMTHHYDGDVISTLHKVLPKLKGAFSIVLMTQDKVFGVRDPHGIRPLCIGKLTNNVGFAVASESCALDIIGAQMIREVHKGEVVVLDTSSVRSYIYDDSKEQALCVFEFIYFARPDSYINGKNIYKVRETMGAQLFAEHPAEADIVIAVPDSGIPAAIGYAKASGLPYEEGLIKNRYVGRTFISPSQILRELGVRIKLNPLKEVLQGKRVVVIDDSIVRGTTSAKIVKLLREAGAKEIHFRVSSPPNISPCFYGIDTATKDQLIAANFSIPEIAKKLNVDSLGYLSHEGLLKTVGATAANTYCLGCFNGCYPEEVSDSELKLDLQYQ